MLSFLRDKEKVMILVGVLLLLEIIPLSNIYSSDTFTILALIVLAIIVYPIFMLCEKIDERGDNR